MPWCQAGTTMPFAQDVIGTHAGVVKGRGCGQAVAGNERRRKAPAGAAAGGRRGERRQLVARQHGGRSARRMAPIGAASES